MDEIYGVSLDRLAELGAKLSEFQAKFGEAQARSEFDRWCADQGMDSNTYWQAYNVWHERFRADPTGQLFARFTMKSAELSQKAHFGDVRDMSQDTREGVTLERYAEITVAMSKPGADAEALARQHGLTDAAHWVRVNAAWTQAMSQDLDHKLTTQFGQLYQKYAGPAFTENLMQQTAAILAESNQPRDRVDEPAAPETADTLLQKLTSSSQKERWHAARRLAHMIDIGSAKGSHYRTACVPVLVEILERHDEYTASDAEDAARRLIDIGESTSDVKSAMARCLNRAEEKLHTLRAAFAPIQDSAVPERIVLQSRIQEYSSLVSSLQQQLADFRDAQAPSTAAPLAVNPTAQAKGGFGFVLPLVAVLLLVGGAAVFFLMKKPPPSTTLNAATAADAASTTSPPAAAGTSQTTTTTPATPETPAAVSGAASAKPGHPGKPHTVKKK
ncbi:MAG TPA: hypothetical protein VGI10_28185 [Polyangiaceae bacterium]|jgi:hypothetical protein